MINFKEETNMESFRTLGINENILKAINELGYSEPTEIQSETIPRILEGRDVIAGSKTGSGKTFAFACGIIDKVEHGKGIQALVLCPTRELAVQVTDSVKQFSRYKRLTITSLYGGVSINPQIDQLRHTDVVIGTPGRVLDHLSQGTLKLDKVKIVVLDEADRMLDMGFILDVKKILHMCPPVRQTLLFSATISQDIYAIAEKYMNRPTKVSVESQVDPSQLAQIFYQVSQNLKFSLLVHLISQTSGLVMIFCNTQRITDKITRDLQKQKIHAIAIHGGLTQAKRTKTMEMFHSGKAYVLVCTDVAARGLHIEDVAMVVNYDIPMDPKQYIHRIGRTARAGKEGIAINILTQRDYENFNNVLREYNLDIQEAELPKLQMIVTEPIERGRFNFREQNRRQNRRY